jgi:hypothetical protein
MAEQLEFDMSDPAPRKRRARGFGPKTKAAIESVDEHADDEWKTVADECAFQVAKREPIVMAEMVRVELRKHPYATTHTLRALGPVMSRARKNGWLKRTDRFARSGDETHGVPTVIWESLIYEKAAS